MLNFFQLKSGSDNLIIETSGGVHPSSVPVPVSIITDKVDDKSIPIIEQRIIDIPDIPITSGRVGLHDFNLLKVIGRGSYAKVFQVEHKPTNRIYAMKVIKKETILDEEVRLVCTFGNLANAFGLTVFHTFCKYVERKSLNIDLVLTNVYPSFSGSGCMHMTI